MKKLTTRAGLLLLTLFFPITYAHGEDFPQKAIIPEIQIAQTNFDDPPDGEGRYDIWHHKESFRKVFESGRHLFTTPFTKEDGAGEGVRATNGDAFLLGPLGPREEDYNNRMARLFLSNFPDVSPDSREAFLKSNEDLFFKFKRRTAPATALRSNGVPVIDLAHSNAIRFDLLRVNGLDSQSCFECHNSIGSESPSGQLNSHALTRKDGAVSGPAGFASDAFIGGGKVEFPAKNETNVSVYPVTEFLRNPPHVFGTGYAQKLAEEMSMDLKTERAEAITEAYLHPNQKITSNLWSKGVNFGSYSVVYPSTQQVLSNPNVKALLLDKILTPGGSSPFVETFSNIVGVSTDLTVRPFQWKGIASDERNFVRSALAFHFGMLPREMTMEDDRDADHDGMTNEVLEGEVTSLTVFTMMTRPPIMAPVPPDKLSVVRRGKELFLGGVANGNSFPEDSCARCHVPSLKLVSSEVSVRDPKFDKSEYLKNMFTLVASEPANDLPVTRRFTQRLTKALSNNNLSTLSTDIQQMRAEEFYPEPGYHFDLSLKNPDNVNSEDSAPESYPRLPENSDGSIDVPLFSDLKRHNMGAALADSFPQETDASGVFVPADEFLTRPLWGVADTGPWLHDGRARTLKEAILMHDSSGSEAHAAVEHFRHLSLEDQDALIQFLLTLRLPVDLRHSADTASLPPAVHPAVK